MAAIGKVAAVFTASTSGLTSGIQSAANAFRGLGGDAGALQSSLAKLQGISLQGIANVGPAAEAAGAAFSGLLSRAESLRTSLQNGAISADQFRDSMAELTRESSALSGVFSAGAQTTAQFATAQERYSAAMASLSEQLSAGAISQETFNRASAAAAATLAESDGSAAAATSAMNELAAVHQRGAAVTRANATAQERYAAEVSDLEGLLNAGAISQETFNRAVSAARQRMQAAGNASTQLTAGLGGIASRLNALIAIDVARFFASIASSISNAVGSFIRFGAAQAETVDSTSKLAARLGMTYGELSGLALAGELAGVGIDQIGAAATRADLAFVRAANGSATAIAAFNTLGLSVEQLSGMNAAGRFDAIASAIAALPTEAQRAAAAVQIFGRAGSELLPLFNGGAEAIAEARREAEAFGLSLTTAQGQDIEGMNDAFTRAQQAIAGVTQQVVAYLAPAVNAFVTQFSDFIANIGGANIGQAIGDGILAGAEYLAGIGDWLIANLSAVWQYVAQVAGNWNGTISVLGQVGAGLRAVFDAAAVAFLTVFRVAITPMSNIIEQLAGLASYLPGVAGQVAGQVAAATAGFREGIDNQIASYSQSFMDNAGQALGGPAQAAGQQLAGPLVTTLKQAREAAQANAAAVDEAKKAPVEITQQVEVAGIAQALKAVDSRSKEGVSEMFRIMRGDTGNVQEKQLEALETIAENTSGMESIPALELTGA